MIITGGSSIRRLVIMTINGRSTLRRLLIVLEGSST